MPKACFFPVDTSHGNVTKEYTCIEHPLFSKNIGKGLFMTKKIVDRQIPVSPG